MPTVLKTVERDERSVGSNPTASSTLQQLLEDKFSVFPEDIKFVFEDCLLVGGAIVSLLRNEDINDFDICLSQEHAILLRRYYKDINDIILILPGNIHITYFTKEEFIEKKYVPTFVHSAVYYDFKEKCLYVTKEQLECIQSKTLKIINPSYRQAYLDKFIDRGWKVHDQ